MQEKGNGYSFLKVSDIMKADGYRENFLRADEPVKMKHNAVRQINARRISMDALEAVFTRRSTRSMKPEAPPREIVEKIIEAGRAAPSGSNSQTTHMIVITKKEVLSELSDLVKEAFAAMEAAPDTYVSLRRSISAAKKGNYVFHYGAPVLIVTANRKGYGNAVADSACVLENMMIAANAMDLGACWINQLHWLDENKKIRDFMEKLELKQDETITGGLILGYGADGTPARGEIKRTGNPVTWICDPEQEEFTR